MRVNLTLAGYVLVVVAALPASASAAASLLTLKHNPFTRPQIPEPKPAPIQAQVVRKAEPVELKLTATMVSDTAPMIIVDGELLALGESIKGLKLVRVLEGKAVFVKAGKTLTFSIGGNPE
jgi:hypothetical protein